MAIYVVLCNTSAKKIGTGISNSAVLQVLQICLKIGKISYFGNNDLSLLEFRPGSNNNVNQSGHLRDRKKNENNILLKTETFKKQKLLERKKINSS